MTLLINCKVVQFPVIYLGMSLSNKILRKEHYMPLIQKVTKKLTTWKASLLLIGGRITLLNVVGHKKNRQNEKKFFVTWT